MAEGASRLNYRHLSPFQVCMNENTPCSVELQKAFPSKARAPLGLDNLPALRSVLRNQLGGIVVLSDTAPVFWSAAVALWLSNAVILAVSVCTCLCAWLCNVAAPLALWLVLLLEALCNCTFAGCILVPALCSRVHGASHPFYYAHGFVKGHVCDCIQVLLLLFINLTAVCGTISVGLFVYLLYPSRLCVPCCKTSCTWKYMMMFFFSLFVCFVCV